MVADEPAGPRRNITYVGTSLRLEFALMKGIVVVGHHDAPWSEAPSGQHG
ncbi:hypothetical protein ROS217_14736 [Roseovarius sp. 217]|nr:hypothetical protein ROS217_14736 [Roseovarius sp. 217]